MRHNLLTVSITCIFLTAFQLAQAQNNAREKKYIIQAASDSVYLDKGLSKVRISIKKDTLYANDTIIIYGNGEVWLREVDGCNTYCLHKKGRFRVEDYLKKAHKKNNQIAKRLAKKMKRQNQKIDSRHPGSTSYGGIIRGKQYESLLASAIWNSIDDSEATAKDLLQVSYNKSTADVITLQIANNTNYKYYYGILYLNPDGTVACCILNSELETIALAGHSTIELNQFHLSAPENGGRYMIIGAPQPFSIRALAYHLGGRRQPKSIDGVIVVTAETRYTH